MYQHHPTSHHGGVGFRRKPPCLTDETPMTNDTPNDEMLDTVDLEFTASINEYLTGANAQKKVRDMTLDPSDNAAINDAVFAGVFGNLIRLDPETQTKVELENTVRISLSLDPRSYYYLKGGAPPCVNAAWVALKVATLAGACAIRYAALSANVPTTITDTPTFPELVARRARTVIVLLADSAVLSVVRAMHMTIESCARSNRVLIDPDNAELPVQQLVKGVVSKAGAILVDAALSLHEQVCADLDRALEWMPEGNYIAFSGGIGHEDVVQDGVEVLPTHAIALIMQLSKVLERATKVRREVSAVRDDAGEILPPNIKFGTGHVIPTVREAAGIGLTLAAFTASIAANMTGVKGSHDLNYMVDEARKFSQAQGNGLAPHDVIDLMKIGTDATLYTAMVEMQVDSEHMWGHQYFNDHMACKKDEHDEPQTGDFT